MKEALLNGHCHLTKIYNGAENNLVIKNGKEIKLRIIDR